MSFSPEVLAERRTRHNASETGMLFGSRWGGLAKYVGLKLGLIPDASKDTESAALGRDLESWVLDCRLARALEPDHYLAGHQMPVGVARLAAKQHAEHDLIWATPDDLVLYGGTHGKWPQGAVLYTVDVKCPGHRMVEEWFEAGGGASVEETPIEHLAQATIQMATFEPLLGHIFAVFSQPSFFVRYLPRNEAREAATIAMIERVWSEYIRPRKMPPPDGTSDAAVLLREFYPRADEEYVCGPTVEDMGARWWAAHEAEKAAAANKAACGQALIEAVGTHKGAITAGGKLTVVRPAAGKLNPWSYLKALEAQIVEAGLRPAPQSEHIGPVPGSYIHPTKKAK